MWLSWPSIQSAQRVAVPAQCVCTQCVSEIGMGRRRAPSESAQQSHCAEIMPIRPGQSRPLPPLWNMASSIPFISQSIPHNNHSSPGLRILTIVRQSLANNELWWCVMRRGDICMHWITKHFDRLQDVIGCLALVVSLLSKMSNGPWGCASAWVFSHSFRSTCSGSTGTQWHEVTCNTGHVMKPLSIELTQSAGHCSALSGLKLVLPAQQSNIYLLQRCKSQKETEIWAL